MLTSKAFRLSCASNTRCATRQPAAVGHIRFGSRECGQESRCARPNGRPTPAPDSADKSTPDAIPSPHELVHQLDQRWPSGCESRPAARSGSPRREKISAAIPEVQQRDDEVIHNLVEVIGADQLCEHDITLLFRSRSTFGLGLVAVTAGGRSTGSPRHLIICTVQARRGACWHARCYRWHRQRSVWQYCDSVHRNRAGHARGSHVAPYRSNHSCIHPAGMSTDCSAHPAERERLLRAERNRSGCPQNRGGEDLVFEHSLFHFSFLLVSFAWLRSNLLTI